MTLAGRVAAPPEASNIQRFRDGRPGRGLGRSRQEILDTRTLKAQHSCRFAGGSSGRLLIRRSLVRAQVGEPENSRGYVERRSPFVISMSSGAISSSGHRISIRVPLEPFHRFFLTTRASRASTLAMKPFRLTFSTASRVSFANAAAAIAAGRSASAVGAGTTRPRRRFALERDPLFEKVGDVPKDVGFQCPSFVWRLHL